MPHARTSTPSGLASLPHSGDDRCRGIDLRGRVVRVPAPDRRMEREPVVLARGGSDGRLDLAPRHRAVAVRIRVRGQVSRVQGDVAALGHVGDEDAAADHGRVHGRRAEQRVALVRSPGPARRQLVERAEERHRLLDRVHPSPVQPGRLVHLRVRRAALDRQRAVQKAARRDPEVEAGRLGNEARITTIATLDRGDRPHRARLLVRDRLEDHVTVEPDPGIAENFERNERRGDSPLHVAGSAPVDPAVPDLGRERVARPTLPFPCPDDVHVTVDHERTSATSPAEDAHRDRPSAPVMPGRHHRVAREGGGIRLPAIDLGTEGA